MLNNKNSVSDLETKTVEQLKELRIRYNGRVRKLNLKLSEVLHEISESSFNCMQPIKRLDLKYCDIAAQLDYNETMLECTEKLLLKKGVLIKPIKTYNKSVS